MHVLLLLQTKPPFFVWRPAEYEFEVYPKAFDLEVWLEESPYLLPTTASIGMRKQADTTVS